jgi:hypothetical protein
LVHIQSLSYTELVEEDQRDLHNLRHVIQNLRNLYATIVANQNQHAYVRNSVMTVVNQTTCVAVEKYLNAHR